MNPYNKRVRAPGSTTLYLMIGLNPLNFIVFVIPDLICPPAADADVAQSAANALETQSATTKSPKILIAAI